MVVEADPVCDHAAGVLEGLEPVAVHALVFERSDHAFDHAVLLRAVRGDEFLLQTIALDQRRVAAAGEHQSVVRPQQERVLDLAQAAVAGDQRLLQRRLGGLGAAAAAEVPTQQFAAVAVDHQSQRSPPITPRPHAAQVRRPTLVGSLGHRRQRLDTRPESHRPLANLPALELEDALHGVLVEPKQMRHRPVAERRVLFDHRLDGLDEVLLNLGHSLGAAVVHRAPGYVEPLAQLDKADLEPVLRQSLLKAKESPMKYS